LGAKVLIRIFAQIIIITIFPDMLITKYVAYNKTVVCTANAYVFKFDCGLSFVISIRQYVYNKI
jgi:hypothetical protein